MGIKSYRDLGVWKKAMELVTEIYKLTEKLFNEFKNTKEGIFNEKTPLYKTIFAGFNITIGNLERIVRINYIDGTYGEFFKIIVLNKNKKIILEGFIANENGRLSSKSEKVLPFLLQVFLTFGALQIV